MRRSERTAAFVEAIWDWYAVHKRVLPWRDLQDQDPTQRAYTVLVSEIMLQQTQVSRVKIVFRDFLERFTTIHDLAAASKRDVLLAWRGMGYNARALRLRDAAREIVGRCEGGREPFDAAQNRQGAGSSVEEQPVAHCSLLTARFPSSLSDLRSIPGIGPYTAAAIRNFAFNIPTPCIDTNIRRILHRTFVGPEHADGTWEKDDRYLLKLAEKILHRALSFSPLGPPSSIRGGGKGSGGRDAANWHAALMDFGSLVQTKRNPKWEECPLTAKHLMVTTPQLWERRQNAPARRLPAGKAGTGRESGRQKTERAEPGRFVGARFIPNRIFRGKIIEELRDARDGLALYTLGQRICLDWSPSHRTWLASLCRKLVQEEMVKTHRGRYVLAD